jgi:hypothetical protein
MRIVLAACGGPRQARQGRAGQGFVPVGVLPGRMASAPARPTDTAEARFHPRSVRAIELIGCCFPRWSIPRGSQRGDLVLLRWGPEVYFPL